MYHSTPLQYFLSSSGDVRLSFDTLGEPLNDLVSLESFTWLLTGGYTMKAGSVTGVRYPRLVLGSMLCTHNCICVRAVHVYTHTP